MDNDAVTLPDDIVARYSRAMRRELELSGLTRMVVDPVVRHVNEMSPHSMISWSACAAATDDAINAVIARERTWFAQREHEVEWKLFDYDAPEHLGTLLERAGFERGPAEAIMVIPTDREIAPLRIRGDKHDGNHDPTDRPRVSDVTDPERVAPIMRAVQQRAFGTEEAWLVDELTTRVASQPQSIHMVVVEQNGEPVSAGWSLYFGGEFAGLFGGATVPEWRDRGLYRATVAARIARMRDRGVAFATVDAGPMSRPILERLGFQAIATSWPYTYRLTRALPRHSDQI